MERRPLDVSLVAVYFVLFSSTLVGILVRQMVSHRIHAPWQDQIIVLPLCFLLALLPAVLALGLWVQDNAARIGAILFVLLHSALEIAWFSSPRIPSKAFTVFRIALNLAIVICLSRPGVRKAFTWQPVRISLRGRGSA
jgi:hypothetical protein